MLPYRFHSRHDIKEKDDRWFSSGRWASAYYDASPAVAERMEVGGSGSGAELGREWDWQQPAGCVNAG